MSDEPSAESSRSVVLPDTGTMGICTRASSISMTMAEEFGVEAMVPSGVEAIPSVPNAA